MFLYYPFHTEEELLAPNFQNYVGKLQEPGTIDIVNTNKVLIEPFSEVVDQAFEQFLNNDKLSQMHIANKKTKMY